MRLSQVTRIIGGETNGARGQENIARMLRASPLMQALDAASAFRQEPTTFLVDDLYIDSDGISYRQIGDAADYTAQEDAPYNLSARTLKAAGWKREYDRSYQADQDIGDTKVSRQFLRMIERLASDTGKQFERDYMVANNTSNKPSGIRHLLGGSSIYKNIIIGSGAPITGVTYVSNNHANKIEYARYLDPTLEVGSSADSFDLADPDHWSSFQEVLDAAIDHVQNAGYIVCNQKLSARINTMARRSNAATSFINSFGQRMPAYEGIPILVVDDAAIPNNEPNKNAEPVNNTTSLYVVNFAENDGVGVATNGIEYIEYSRLPSSPRKMEQMEIRYAPVIDNGKAIIRVPLIKV